MAEKTDPSVQLDGVATRGIPPALAHDSDALQGRGFAFLTSTAIIDEAGDVSRNIWSPTRAPMVRTPRRRGCVGAGAAGGLGGRDRSTPFAAQENVHSTDSRETSLKIPRKSGSYLHRLSDALCALPGPSPEGKVRYQVTVPERDL